MSDTALYQLYRPSNGGEGEVFMDRFCRHCEKDRAFREDRSPRGCDLILRAMMYQTDDPEYPQEWRERNDGGFRGYCTAFEQQKSPSVSIPSTDNPLKDE